MRIRLNEANHVVIAPFVEAVVAIHHSVDHVFEGFSPVGFGRVHSFTRLNLTSKIGLLVFATFFEPILHRLVSVFAANPAWPADR